MESGTCQRSNGSACTGSTGSAARSVRSAVSSYLYKHTKRSPMVLPVIIEV